jgi:hypothetical protein
MPKQIYDHVLYRAPTGRIAPLSRQSLGAVTDSIAPSALVVLRNTTGGTLTMTSTPTLANGQNGERCTLLNVSPQTIVLRDEGTLAGSNLRLGATVRNLGERDVLTLLFVTDVGDWIELGFNSVL